MAIFGIAACSKAPDGILSERKMKDVMVDMYIAENMINSGSQEFPDSLHKQALFQSVFKKHNITQATYDSSLVWYGKNIDIMMQVLDLAIADVNERIRDLGDVQASAAPSSNQDSVNIWPRRDFLVLQPNALFNGVTFEIKPERNYSSGSAFVLNMNVWGVTQRMPQKPEVRLTIEQIDTTLVVNKTITGDGFQQIVLRGIPTRQIRRVHGYIRMDNTDANYYKVYIDHLNLIKYNYGSQALEAVTGTSSSAGFSSEPETAPPAN